MNDEMVCFLSRKAKAQRNKTICSLISFSSLFLSASLVLSFSPFIHDSCFNPSPKVENWNPYKIKLIGMCKEPNFPSGGCNGARFFTLILFFIPFFILFPHYILPFVLVFYYRFAEKVGFFLVAGRESRGSRYSEIEFFFF